MRKIKKLREIKVKINKKIIKNYAEWTADKTIDIFKK